MGCVQPRLVAIRANGVGVVTGRPPLPSTEHDRTMVAGGGQQTRPRVFGQVPVANDALDRCVASWTDTHVRYRARDPSPGRHEESRQAYHRRDRSVAIHWPGPSGSSPLAVRGGSAPVWRSQLVAVLVAQDPELVLAVLREQTRVAEPCPLEGAA